MFIVSSKLSTPFSVANRSTSGKSTTAESEARRYFDLSRLFSLSYYLADVKKLNLLQHYDLLVDIKNRRLIGKCTSISVKASSAHGLSLGLKTLSDSSYHKLLNQFSSLTNLTFLGINHGKQEFTHCILMKEPPVFGRARCLSSEKLVAAKTVKSFFQSWICLPSSAFGEGIHHSAIITPFGSFAYLQMYFGLSKATQSFQRFIYNIFIDLNCCAYVDDVLLGSESEEQHLKELEEVFKLLKSFGIILDLKSTFSGKVK
ncbi:retrovirus-related Pol polyprotein from transposon 297 [Trichonephila inaurata madagascariensis]|uniref:Retrovirus-related Pol polyprotein from transposon 297 n=1 Tax=Trichonephila inaurata madagascariensis TaxID=2747483 RepID=A0A8X7CDF0_9ARAC|nr:retrovirus-related Pol polyprotein from transposon 297 [Trichonephila inaurata madagascariensis]